MEDIGKGLIAAIVMLAIFFGLLIVGGYAIIDKYAVDHSIKSHTLIKPEIKLVIEDNKVDTIYVYKQPKK